MSIWDILQIEPTQDQRAIKKAYAKRSREVHPEEKPEEFSQLYDAYKSALAYAQYAKKQASCQEAVQEQADEDQPQPPFQPQSQPPFQPQSQSPFQPQPQLPFQPQSQPRKNPEEGSELYHYFWEKQEKVNKKLIEFQKQWEKIQTEYGLPLAVSQWEEYLKSDHFQEIRFTPQVLERLIREIEMLKHSRESKLALWNAYGFMESADLECQGDVRRLYDVLLPDYKDRKKEEEEEERLKRVIGKMKEKKKKMALYKKGLVLLLILACVAIPSFIALKRISESNTVADMMQERYPGDSFTKPKRDGSYYESPVFRFSSINHPQIRVSAILRRDFNSQYKLQEDYGLQILQLYGKAYGLEFSSKEDYENYEKFSSYDSAYVLLYSGIDDVDRVCDNLYKMLDGEGKEELSFLDSLGICWKDAAFPQIMLGGGVQSRPPAPVYQVNHPGVRDSLKQSVKDSWEDYMYNYEAWNLTPQQQKAYGPDYVERQRAIRVKNSGSPWSSDSDIKKIEEEFNLCIPIYNKTVYNQIGTSVITHNAIYITIGNAYQLLKASGTAVSVNKDGSGFVADKVGRSFVQEELNLKDVKELMEDQEGVLQ